MHLPPKHQVKVHAAIKSTTPASYNTSLPKLIELMQIITLPVAGACVMFTRVHHDLTKASRWHVHLATNVHNKLDACCDLISSLASRPTRLCEINPPTPTWVGDTDTSRTGTSGVCRDPEGQYFV